MNDQFLKNYREPPRPEFARQLQDKCADYSADGGTIKMQTQKTWRQNVMRWSPALIAAALLVAAVLVFTLPPTRALAQDFLNLFRVKKFAAIAIDPARMKQLDNLQLDTEQLLADNVQVLQEPGKPIKVASAQEAGERAGFTVAVPSVLPKNASVEAFVQGEGAGVITADTQKLQELLDLVGITDVQVPAQLDGAKITVRKPAAVMLEYKVKNGSFSLMQSPSPEVELPPGVELKQLGEIGLRVLGLSADEARDFANKVDWSSTFLIPIPANAAEVRQVTVNGADGLMLTSNGTARNMKNPTVRGNAVILWANNGMVYAMEGKTNAVDLLEIANSVQ